ncbi:aminoglycoside adenylyltransferase domain-containing protein [Streptomyces luteogriseus]|uniref:aminoglycoside adenylyltransferase domain-containing protein n=1 Tax=Streptomyces luteogriseus TaxID=68233 RepID=UPI0037B098F7
MDVLAVVREPARDGQRRVLVRELPDHLRRAIVAGVPEPPEELATDTRNVLLTLGRAWTTLDAAGIRSKDARRRVGRRPAARRTGRSSITPGPSTSGTRTRGGTDSASAPVPSSRSA